MTVFDITYACDVLPGTSGVIAPGGISTPHGTCTGVHVQGGDVVRVQEAHTGQVALHIVPHESRLRLTFTCDDAVRQPYPDAVFVPIPSRFTRFASDLLDEAQADAGALTGLERARAVACATAARFDYGHPDARFNDGLDQVPALGCGLTEGSCVDINTYFIAALRAAGIEAGYVTGFFFPAEKGDHCTDGHCWVVTRIDGATQEWDIAHHLKTGTRDIRPGLNPRPGFRAACFHSMGLDFPGIAVHDLKALIEPMALVGTDLVYFQAPEIRLHHPDIRRATARADGLLSEH